MEQSRVIWRHEEDLADRIARGLLERSGNITGWKAIFFPGLIVNYIRFRKNLFVTRKNLLFTRRLAFDAAVEISHGQDRESESDTIDKKTKEILLKEGKGLYNEKVRRKQMSEIELLIDHYSQFLNSDKESDEEIVRHTYGSRKIM